MFTVGACGYGTLELLWRGYTHWSMLGAGGICFVIFGGISEQLKRVNLIIKCVAGSAVVTAIEFVIGLIFNVGLKKNIWNYSNQPLNIGGQVCALYSFLWMILSLIFIPFAGRLNQQLKKRQRGGII